MPRSARRRWPGTRRSAAADTSGGTGVWQHRGVASDLHEPLVVPARFTGPPTSGNGGWVAGALAARLPEARAVTVRLSSPPPLDVPLAVSAADGPDGAPGVRAERDGVLVGAAWSAAASLAAPYDPPDVFVPFEDAVAAASGYPGALAHPFPSCFVCSPVHPSGLRLTPARPPGGRPGVTATPWVPDASLDAGDGCASTAAVWAALDCPGGWAQDIADRLMVLGTATGAVARRPRTGEECIVVGTARGGTGRKALATTTLFAADGERLAWTAQVWITVDPAALVPA